MNQKRKRGRPRKNPLPVGDEAPPKAKAKAQPKAKAEPKWIPKAEWPSGSAERPLGSAEPKAERPSGSAQPKAKAQPTAKAQPKTKPPPVNVDTKPKTTRHKHSTEKYLSVDPEYWRKQTIGYLREQLSLRGVKQFKTAAGTNMTKTADYLREILKMI